MQRFAKMLISGALCAALAACSSQPPASATPLAGAPTHSTCDGVEVVQDSPDTTAALRSALDESKMQVSSLSARAHGTQCRGSASTPQPSFSPSSIDFKIDVPRDDLTAPLQIGIATSTVLAALDQAAPDMPGNVALTFTNADTSLPLSFSRDQARKATGSRLTGVMLLAALGYPPKAAGGASCAVVWGKQPLLNLTRQAREEFDKAGLTDVGVAIAANGTWCADSFSAAQTELHIDLGWMQNLTKQDIGNLVANVFDALLRLPPDEMPGKLPPRVVVVTGWDVRYFAIITLAKAKALHEANLTGTDMLDKVGFQYVQ